MLFGTTFESPIGTLGVTSSEDATLGVAFDPGEVFRDLRPNDAAKRCVSELLEYFYGDRKSFSVKLDIRGTEFRLLCWNELLKIPYGETISYGKLAENIGNKRAVRAVGGANHHNPLPIIIPCHRVIGSDGKLVGYGGELWRKEWLLKHERRNT